jgi:XRE family transcriptional regulator, regulator of sulfur utilization
MKLTLVLALPLLIVGSVCAQTPPGPAATEKLASAVYDWDNMSVTKTPLGERRAVFDAPTATLAKLHCHITTLNPGQRSGESRKHVQEEVIIVKEGLVEANWDGQSKTSGPGSVIFFAAGATTFLRNAGTTPATYIIINYYPPAEPKH